MWTDLPEFWQTGGPIPEISLKIKLHLEVTNKATGFSVVALV